MLSVSNRSRILCFVICSTFVIRASSFKVRQPPSNDFNDQGPLWLFGFWHSFDIGNLSFVILEGELTVSQLQHPAHSFRQIERVRDDNQRHAFFPVQLD